MMSLPDGVLPFRNVQWKTDGPELGDTALRQRILPEGVGILPAVSPTRCRNEVCYPGIYAHHTHVAEGHLVEPAILDRMHIHLPSLPLHRQAKVVPIGTPDCKKPERCVNSLLLRMSSSFLRTFSSFLCFQLGFVIRLIKSCCPHHTVQTPRVERIKGLVQEASSANRSKRCTHLQTLHLDGDCDSVCSDVPPKVVALLCAHASLQPLDVEVMPPPCQLLLTALLKQQQKHRLVDFHRRCVGQTTSFRTFACMTIQNRFVA